MKTSTMTVKGQVTIPKELRDRFGFGPGDRLAFVPEEDGIKILRKEARPRGGEVLEKLRRAPWNPELSTDELMALTRGVDG
jgi:AbrB family looped-hinge helix DNA binding protein